MILTKSNAMPYHAMPVFARSLQGACRPHLANSVAASHWSRGWLRMMPDAGPETVSTLIPFLQLVMSRLMLIFTFHTINSKNDGKRDQ